MEISPDLAEIIGIHVGDGYLRYEGKRRELDISGGYEEMSYYDNHVIPLFNKVFGLSIKGKFFLSRKTYGFVIRDKTVLDIFKNLKFPSGSKSTTVRVPQQILYSSEKEVITSFLRGFFDTDGCLTFFNRRGLQKYSLFKKRYHYYPRIILVSVSKDLIADLVVLLNKLQFKFHQRKKVHQEANWNFTYELCLGGRRNLIRWMALIGTNNPVKMSRYQVWEEYGFCPTNTTFNQRINILNGKLNLYQLYNGPIA